VSEAGGGTPRGVDELTELGMIELHVPRTRTFSALKVVRAYADNASTGTDGVKRADTLERLLAL